MKILRGLYAIIRTILTIAIISLLAVVLTQRLSDNKMSVAGFRIFTVVTESMVPEYQIGDAILVRSIEPEEIQEGDDVTYLGEKSDFQGKIVTHRVLSKKKLDNGMYEIVTKGIANEVEDPAINNTQVYGKVIYKIKTISYINGIVGNLYGMYFVIVVPMAFMMFFEYLGWRKDKDEEKEEQEKEKNKEKKKSKNKEDKNNEEKIIKEDVKEEINKEKEKDKEQDEDKDKKKREKRKAKRNKRRQRRKVKEE